MNNNEQTDMFVIALDNLVDRFTREFDLNLYTLAGVLDEKKIELLTNKDIYFDSDLDLDE
tara:strand:+ start:4853 stop:5032 length:180 start_codon:yes stop_codon:yes gene_type:complete